MLDNWSIATKSFIQIYIKYFCSHINYTSIYFIIGSTSHIEEIDLKSEIVTMSCILRHSSDDPCSLQNSPHFYLRNSLAIRNRCWTADRLARRGLPHPSHCSFCDQEEENIQHILTTCVLAREFWCRIFSVLGLQYRIPSPHEISFTDWWRKAVKKLQKDKKKGLNTVIILAAWILWKHHNACL